MKKYGKLILILVIAAIIGIAFFYFVFQRNKSTFPSYEGARLSGEENSFGSENVPVKKEVISETEHEEIEISKFSTPILVDDDNRDINLKISASKINGTVVKSKEDFSFNNVVGNPTPDKGYKEARILVKGKKEKGYGGGNCQVCTTVYNAVLAIKDLEVTERHEHGKDVGYIEEGKDATVVYDELDLKFKNNADYDIKLYANVTEEKIEVRIVKLS